MKKVVVAGVASLMLFTSLMMVPTIVAEPVSQEIVQISEEAVALGLFDPVEYLVSHNQVYAAYGWPNPVVSASASSIVPDYVLSIPIIREVTSKAGWQSDVERVYLNTKIEGSYNMYAKYDTSYFYTRPSSIKAFDVGSGSQGHGTWSGSNIISPSFGEHTIYSYAFVGVKPYKVVENSWYGGNYQVDSDSSSDQCIVIGL